MRHSVDISLSVPGNLSGQRKSSLVENPDAISSLGGCEVIIGKAALFLYSLSYCWNGGTDCMASPTRKWISFLLAPPIFLMQRLFFGTVNNVANFDPVIFGRFGWAALSGYYFVVVSLAMRLVQRYLAISRENVCPNNPSDGLTNQMNNPHA
jgi:hypothetical protein